MGIARPSFGLLMVGVLGCHASPPIRIPVAFAGSPPDAYVTIDETYCCTLAEAARHGLPLPAGKHRITVEKAGYFPWDTIVDVIPDPSERIRVEAEMTRIPE